MKGGPLHKERVRLSEAYRMIAVPIPRDLGWPCEFALYTLEKVEVRAFEHRYVFQGVRRATYAERFLFDGGGHNWEARGGE